MDELARTIQLFRDSGPDAALALVRTGVGARLTEQIQAVLASITAEEDRLLALRKAASNNSEARARALALGTTLLAMALLAAAVWLLARERARLAATEAGQRLLAEQMRSAFDSISQGIGVFEPDFRLTRWNPCFHVILGVPAPMMRQGTPYEAIAEQAAVVANGPFLETEDQIRHGPGGRSQNEPIVYERTRASDERSFELRRTTTPGGGFVLTLTDVTERVRSEKTARELAAPAGDGPVDRRHRARLQQPAHGDPGQPGTARVQARRRRGRPAADRARRLGDQTRRRADAAAACFRPQAAARADPDRPLRDAARHDAPPAAHARRAHRPARGGHRRLMAGGGGPVAGGNPPC